LIIAGSSIHGSSAMSDTHLTLKLALDHIVRDLLKQALNQLEAAGALISAFNDSNG
jgi:hypothetical protein